ncbi:hypothetical protein GEV33_006435 [Tenebrio molitor]|uniref:Uncharacterized protein n=1 Tax=Tenebrio molitor TaxID=7067 RepID=A0A8J6HLT8_TENMO|nr:hypothetical protein GEV33_006435 [Tenebrio molitor]
MKRAASSMSPNYSVQYKGAERGEWLSVGKRVGRHRGSEGREEDRSAREVRTQTPESELAGPRRELPEESNAKERNQIPRPDFVVHSDLVGVPEEYPRHRGDDSPGRPRPRRGWQTNKILLWEGISVIGPFRSHIRAETPDGRTIGQRNQIGGYRPFTPFTSQLLASGTETTLGFTNSSEVAAHVAVACQDL